MVSIFTKEEQKKMARFAGDMEAYVELIAAEAVKKDGDKAAALGLYKEMQVAEAKWANEAKLKLGSGGKMGEFTEDPKVTHGREVAKKYIELVTDALIEVEKALKKKGWI